MLLVPGLDQGEPEPPTGPGDADSAGDLTGCRIAVHHSHDPLEGTGRRWVSGGLADPPAHGPSGESWLGPLEGAAVGRVEVGGEAVEKVPLGAGERGGPNEQRNRVTA